MNRCQACWAILLTDTRLLAATAATVGHDEQHKPDQYHMFQRVFAGGMPCLIAITVVPNQPRDRRYQEDRVSLIDAVYNTERIAWYQRHAIHASVAGNHQQLADVVQLPKLPTEGHCCRPRRSSQNH